MKQWLALAFMFGLIISYSAAAVARADEPFDRTTMIVPGYGHGASSIPKSAAPDVVGAFRFMCAPGQINYDDPILYPGVKNGSPHAHQWYGNTAGDYTSTHSSLRSRGDSTCSNRLNRSAYWVPTLLTEDGRAIRPDYIAIYYKRLPKSDPACVRTAPKGCVGIPTGLRAVSGYDLKRMGMAQPENATYHHRCIIPGKSSVHRPTVTAAIADCGGAGQIMTAITFGSCWNGALDSADHRSHLTNGSYGNWGYPKCPRTHPYLLPALTQQIAYTILASDGDVHFASDRMNGMTMAAGSTFHADYMEGWDEPTRRTWEINCIDKMLTCVDGELGDGTMLKRGPNPSQSNPRLTALPRIH